MIKKKYDPVFSYSQSKQSLIYFTYELAERLKNTGVTSNCFYPGLVKTNLGKVDKGFRKITYKVLTFLLQSLFTPIEEAIKLGIFLAVSKKAEGMTGRFIKREKNKIIINKSYEKEISEDLWAVSEKFTGIKFKV
jgi:NAD(P)-dependent dehydrogenase (short-subunit alcohol dehydrogenase family)